MLKIYDIILKIIIFFPITPIIFFSIGIYFLVKYIKNKKTQKNKNPKEYFFNNIKNDSKIPMEYYH
jgi:hypothetical protein